MVHRIRDVLRGREVRKAAFGQSFAQRRGHLAADLAIEILPLNRVDYFLRTHHPHVIVFDIAPPYGLNWRLLDRLREMPSAKNVRFIVTSVNPDRAEELSRGGQTIYEVIGKPYDLGRIVDAARDAARTARDGRIADGLLHDAVAHHRRNAG